MSVYALISIGLRLAIFAWMVRLVARLRFRDPYSWLFLLVAGLGVVRPLAALLADGITPVLDTTATTELMLGVVANSLLLVAAVALSELHIRHANRSDTLRRAVTRLQAESRDRAAAEQALRAQQQQLKLVTDAMPATVSYVDADMIVRFTNATGARWYGRPREAIIGRPLAEVMTKETLKRLLPRYRAALAGEFQDFEEQVSIEGEARNARLIYTPHRDEHGVVQGFFSLALDITERRQMEEQLRRSQRMDALGQLTGGIAHEFNNLLQVFVGNLDLLDDIAPPGHPRHRQLQLLRRAADRAADLTHRLLAFSRQQPLRPALINIRPHILDAQAMLSRTLAPNITVVTNLPEDTWCATVDPAQFDNAVLNLCLNARDAMPDGGRITIAAANVALTDKDAGRHDAATAGDYVAISVSDTGCGMPPEIAARAFEPFFTTKGVGEGTGLGLSMVHGFASQSGGFAEIDSTVGDGTTVRLYLPRTTCVARATAANIDIFAIH